MRKTGKAKTRGRLRIGNDWNAITIIALSQNNPLKAIAELVENSIDAQSKHITIIRGKEKEKPYLKIIDDGDGIPCTAEGMPDFKYVATHICDSLKRRLREEGVKNIQGEFGIGLLSFWTVGHKLIMISSGRDNKTYQMEMENGKPGYSIAQRHRLLPIRGTQITISPLLAGIRTMNGEKINRYLASELRDRIRRSGVKIAIVDRTSRAEFDVKPRRFSGQILHNLPKMSSPSGDIYVELYLSEKNVENTVGLFRSGTRVLPSITKLDEFQCEPWTEGYFQGIIDVPFLHLTPGTRDGIIRDEAFVVLCNAITPLQEQLKIIAREQNRAEEERMSKNILRSVRKAIREAIFLLPQEEYDWFDIYEKHKNKIAANHAVDTGTLEKDDKTLIIEEKDKDEELKAGQKEFFEFPGPLFSARIIPGSALVESGKTKSFRAVGFDRKKQHIDEALSFKWEITEGNGILDKTEGEIVVFNAPEDPELNMLKVTVFQGNIHCQAESIITIVDNLAKFPDRGNKFPSKGLPGYTLKSMPGELWRSNYDKKRNIIIINSGHRDFVYAGRQKARKLRYICRLFAKELIHHNFAGAPTDQLLERMVELSLYSEENLK